MHLLFAIREEHVGGLEFYSDYFPNHLHIRYQLQGLRSEQAKEAILHPLAACGVAMSNELAEKLVDSLRTVPVKTSGGVRRVAGEFVEPLHLQVVCRNLVTRLQPGATTITEGMVASFANVDQALSDFYERAVATAARESQLSEMKIRRWFENELITDVGTRGIVFQGEAETAGLPNRCVSVLARESIVRGERRAGALWYELTHDRFIDPIRNSNLKWREARGESYRMGERLQARAAKWEQAGRRVEDLLNETELEEALHWISNSEAAQAGYSEEIQSLLLASTAEVQQRKERQLRLEAEARSARRFRSLSLILALTSVLAVAFFLWGLRGEQQRQEQQRLAQSLGRAAEAVKQLDTAPEQSILLAMNAMAARVTPEAQDALNRALHDLQLVRTLTDHGDRVTTLAFSPSGDLLATGSRDHTAKIWNTRTWGVVHTLPFYSAEVRSLSFSPDGRFLVTASNNRNDAKNSMLEEWDVSTGTPRNKVLRTEWVTGVAHHPREPLIATVEGGSGTIHLWEATGLREVAQWKHGAVVNMLSFSPDGDTLAAADLDNIVKVWNVAACRENPDCEPSLILRGHTRPVMAVAFSPDGRYVASAGMDRTLRLWDSKSENLRTIFTGHSNTVFGLAFDNTGRLLSGSADGRVKIWDPLTGRELLALAGHTSSVASVAVSPNGKMAATASWDHTVKIWSLGGHRDAITEVAFSGDGRYVATSSRDKTVKLWDAATLEEIQTLPEYQKEVSMVTFNQDGTLLAAASDEKTIGIWNVAEKTWLTQSPHQTVGNSSAFNNIVFNPRQPEAVTGSKDGSIFLWQLSVAVPPRLLGQHKRAVFALAFSPDGKRVASTAQDERVFLWDTSSAAPQATCSLVDKQDFAVSIVFSPDGNTLATAGPGGKISLWEVGTCPGAPIRSFLGHTNTVNALAFSPDGKELASASWDATVRIWDVATGQEKRRFDLDGSATGVAFSPDGKRLGIASNDVLPRIYILDPKSLMEKACERMKQLGTTSKLEGCSK
ncbi:MAG: WD40 repeat domain-containing protein [Acidobacteriia bacterium]|nr:WD40 repeat domain-containing protein [Terriglobia bacterium]